MAKGLKKDRSKNLQSMTYDVSPQVSTSIKSKKVTSTIDSFISDFKQQETFMTDMSHE